MSMNFLPNYPKPVEIPKVTYEANKESIDAEAKEAGYRLLGLHAQTQLYIWTAKP